MKNNTHSTSASVDGYHFTQCGLDNVYLEGVELLKNDANETIVRLPGLAVVLPAIALSICSQPTRLKPVDLRFLRRALLMKQDEFGELFNKTRVTISRWESGSKDIEPNTEVLIRLYVAEQLLLEGDFDRLQFKVPSARDLVLEMQSEKANNEVVHILKIDEHEGVTEAEVRQPKKIA